MLIILLTFLFLQSTKSQPDNAFVESINALNTTWKAGNNSHPSPTRKSYNEPPGISKINPKSYTIHDIEPNLPEEFDSRQHWPHCPTIGEILDQGSCGSCWVFAAAGAMSDRICISSGKVVRLSPQNLLTCCKNCGNCHGGHHVRAWDYWVKHGIVTGGGYGSRQGCQSYTFPPCNHYVLESSNPNCVPYGSTPSCSKICDPHYTIPYEEDLYYGKTWYGISRNEKAIRTEIFRHGPVQASMATYADYYVYKSGVYQHVKGGRIGDHSIKIIGWGIDSESSTPYWLISNALNTDWGENGFLRIKRGTNECDCEKDVHAGLYRD